MKPVENGLIYLKSLLKEIHFILANEESYEKKYFITDKCVGCKVCQGVCPQNCIDFTSIPAEIHQKNCLHCGNCMEVCPNKAVVWR